MWHHSNGLGPLCVTPHSKATKSERVRACIVRQKLKGVPFVMPVRSRWASPGQGRTLGIILWASSNGLPALPLASHARYLPTPKGRVPKMWRTKVSQGLRFPVGIGPLHRCSKATRLVCSSGPENSPIVWGRGATFWGGRPKRSCLYRYQTPAIKL